VKNKVNFVQQLKSKNYTNKRTTEFCTKKKKTVEECLYRFSITTLQNKTHWKHVFGLFFPLWIQTYREQKK